MQSEGFLTGRPLAAPGRLSGLWESTQGFRHGDGPDKYLRQREHRKRLFTVHWVGQTTSGSKDPSLRPVRRRPPLGPGPGPGGRRLFHAKGKGSEMRSRSCGETLSPQGSFLWEGAGRPRSLRGASGRAPLARLRPALATPQGGGPALTPPRLALATPPEGSACRGRGARRALAGCRFPRPPPRVGPGRALPPAAPQPTQAQRLPSRICASPGSPPAAPGLSLPLPRALPALAAIQARSTRPVPSCSLCLDIGPSQRASRR